VVLSNISWRFYHRTARRYFTLAASLMAVGRLGACVYVMADSTGSYAIDVICTKVVHLDVGTLFTAAIVCY
jgi:hypothetical protein